MSNLVKWLQNIYQKTGPVAAIIVSLVSLIVGIILFVKFLWALKDGAKNWKKALEFVGAIVFVGLGVAIGITGIMKLGGNVKPDSDLIPSGSNYNNIRVAEARNYGEILNQVQLSKA